MIRSIRITGEFYGLMSDRHHLIIPASSPWIPIGLWWLVFRVGRTPRPSAITQILQMGVIQKDSKINSQQLIHEIILPKRKIPNSK